MAAKFDLWFLLGGLPIEEYEGLSLNFPISKLPRTSPASDSATCGHGYEWYVHRWVGE